MSIRWNLGAEGAFYGFDGTSHMGRRADTADSLHEDQSIHRLSKEDLVSPGANPVSTHELKLEHTLKIGEKILGDKFPSEITIFGVEVGEVKEGIALSPKVEKSLPRLVDLILQEL